MKLKSLQFLIRYSFMIALLFMGVIQNGYAQFDVTQASFTFVAGNPFSVAAQEAEPSGITFSNDGLRMCIVGLYSNSITQYELTTPFDIATASFTPAINNPLVTSMSNISGIVFSTNGLRMFIVNSSSVRQYELTTAFDITTALFTTSTNNPFSLAGLGIVVEDITFSSNGLLMFIVGGFGTSQKVYRYQLTTAFDITTASFTTSTNNPFSVAAQEPAVKGITFSNDGLRMFIVGGSLGLRSIHQYQLTIAFDTRTSSFTASVNNPFSVATQEALPTGVAFSSDGLRMFVVGSSSKNINQYQLGAAFDITTASFTASGNPFSVENIEGNSQGITFSNDGLRMFVVGSGTNGIDGKVSQYQLTTAFDITTASFIAAPNNPFSVAAQETSPEGITFSSNGLRMFIVGISGRDVNQYQLTTAFDITTASFISTPNNPFSVVAQEGSPRGIAFSNDGLRMFIVGVFGNDVNQYQLTTAFDITTASFTAASNNPFPLVSSTTDITFSNDGLRMFIAGGVFGSRAIYQYQLTTAFDITTASLISISNNPFIQESNAWKVAFSNNGSKMFIVSSGNQSKISQYDIATSSIPEINLQAGSPLTTISDGDITPSLTDNTDFGSIAECGTNTIVKTFTIQNTGTVVLNITGITLGGTDAADFTLGTLPTSVAAGGNETFTITFNPSATGNRVATVNIANNDADENPYNFSIQGTGTADATNPTITAPTNVSANTDVGLCTASGVALGTPTGVDNCGTPIFTNNAPATFPIGTTTVTWTATDGTGNTATADQTVTVTSTREINLLGNAVSIVDGDATPNVADNTDFGSTTSRTITYTIENAGTEAITISSITSSNIADFTITGTVPTSVVGGGNVTFDVTFIPSATGTRNATITINNNDCNEAIYDFAVQGTGIISTGDVLLVETGINYPTIQAAVDAALAGNNIKMTVAKNYNENVIVNKNLFFTSDFTNYKNVNIDQIKVNTGTKLTITGDMSIVEMLYMEGNSEVEVSGSTTDFALNSTDSATAMVVNESTNTVVGNVIMERFLKPVNDIGGTNGLGYHLFSSPFTNATISQFADNMNLVLNFAFNTAPEPAYVRPFPNFFTYQETNMGVIGGTLYSGRYFVSNYRVPTANPLDILAVGKGYQANIATSAVSGNTVDLNGTLNNGDYLIPLTNSGGAGLIALGQDGFNLIGNPYPSPLDWDKIIGNDGNSANAGNSNVADAIYMDIPITQYEGSFASYIDEVDVNGGQGKIASMQSFFVKCTAPTGTLELKNEDRVQTYEDVRFFKTEKEESAKEGLIKIALKKGDKMDETAIYFKAGATPNFDPKFDALKIYKMNSQYSSLYSYNHNEISDKQETFAINGLGSFDEDKTLPLGMNILADGEYEITLRNMKYFHSKHELYLYDSLTDSLHNLRSEGDYKFVAKKVNELKRFVLLFKTAESKGFFEEEKVMVYPNPTPNEFSYSLKTSREGNYTVRLFDATGRVIFEEVKTKEGAFLEGTINLEKQSAGLYLLQIVDSKKTMTVRVVKE